MTYTKNANGQLVEVKEVEIIYDYKALLDQKTDLETKLAEVDVLIAEAKKAGIK